MKQVQLLHNQRIVLAFIKIYRSNNSFFYTTTTSKSYRSFNPSLTRRKYLLSYKKKVIDIAHHPTILFHYGAYTFIRYNIYEIYSHDYYSFDTTAVIAFPSRNYDGADENFRGSLRQA